jgi:peptidoglycan/LPS O-acetylase OafA/YrhL
MRDGVPRNRFLVSLLCDREQNGKRGWLRAVRNRAMINPEDICIGGVQMALEIQTDKMKGSRIAYLDNLRSWVIFLVVVMHSNVTYSGMGGWYYKEGNPGLLDVGSMFAFGFYGSFTQAWFMGLLFFTAAVFAARSLAKRGTAAFIKERLFRLGIPLLIYMFVIEPCIAYFIMNYDDVRSAYSPIQAYAGYITSFSWIGSTGPLWFAEALILFCLAYALVRLVRPLKDGTGTTPPSARAIALIILATGLAAFSIRLFFPIGSSVLNLQFSFFASYIALFILGILAGEGGWFETLIDRFGLRWFVAVLAVGIPLWCLLMVTGGALRGKIPIDGGLYWQSFAYAFWEAFVAVGFSLGITAFFKKYLNRENAATRFLADNAFGVYMFHAPILIMVSLAFRDWYAPLLAKHALVAPLAFAASLAFSALIRRIPPMKAILK